MIRPACVDPEMKNNNYKMLINKKQNKNNDNTVLLLHYWFEDQLVKPLGERDCNKAVPREIAASLTVF
jgi:hypothetical protein